MDLRTVMLMLGFGSLLFGFLLILFKIKHSDLPETIYWIVAKFFQAIGSLLLYFKSDTYDTITVIANIILILGCANEARVIRILSGKAVKSRRNLIVATISIIVLCLITIYLPKAPRNGIIFLLQSIFYFLPSIFLLNKSEYKSYLKTFLGICYFVTGIVFFGASFISFAFPGFVTGETSRFVFGIIPTTSFCIFLISGFILLMLAKERSDMLVKEIQKSLEKSEIRFQRIVETSIEGIIIFDENYQITFVNKNMASMLGYSVEEMLGKFHEYFLAEEQIEITRQQAALRKKGADSVYECLLKRKDGNKHWFLVSAKSLQNEKGEFEGSFAMLTDINDRKEMEMLLKDLSNKDSLTGIANRRKFDEVLEKEYNRLSRSNSKLSIIIFDIDLFKEYNDFYGHVKGDEVISQIGFVLSNCISRSVDLAARYGGEEFAIILPDTELIHAIAIAKKIQASLHELKIEHLKSTTNQYVTASFGIITVKYSPDRSPKDVITMADQLLYKAKAHGRNRIEFAEWED